MKGSLALLAILIALPGAAVAVQYTLLAVGSILYRRPSPAAVPHLRFLVLVPAHNEAAVLGRTLEALHGALRPGDQALIVDDRSGDGTGDIARRAGALVLRREPGEPPGRSAARQAGIRFALERRDWDVLAAIDADSIVEPGYLDALERAFATGAEAVQARSEAVWRPGLVAEASLAAFVLQGVVIPRGRDHWHLSVRLKGTGMALRRGLLEGFGFRGPGAGEDLWLSNDLLLGGVMARHADDARLRSESTASVRAASAQRVRWEAGRMIAAREFVPRLLRRPTPATIEAALHLLTPPFALAVSSLLLSASIAGLAAGWQAAAGPMLLLCGLAWTLAVGLVQAGAPRSTWLSLLAAPAYIAFKTWVQIRATVAALGTRHEFPATPRD